MDEAIKPQEAANWDLYRALRDQWTHEDNLANHRVMWLTLAQGLLLTAYGSISAHRKFLLIAFPIFGIVVAIVIAISIYAALNSTDVIRRQYEKAGLNQLCPIAPPGFTRSLGNLAARLLPFVFIAVWVLALIAAIITE